MEGLLASADEQGVAVSKLFLEFLNTFEVAANAVDNEAPVGEVGETKKYVNELQKMVAAEASTLYVDFEDVMNSDDNLQHTICEEYFRFESYLRSAVQTFGGAHAPDFVKPKDGGETQRELYLSFYNFPRVYRLRELTTTEIGKLVSVSGVVTRTSEVRPELISGTFKCLDCGAVIRHVEQQFKYTQPIICMNATCANRERWALLRQDSRFSDWQRVKMQENSGEIPAGSLPRSLDIVLRHEIVEQARAGDKCIFTGTVVVVPDIAAMAPAGDRQETRREGVPRSGTAGGDGIHGLKALGVRDLSYRLAFLANSVQALDKKGSKVHGGKMNDVEDAPSFTAAELEEFRRISSTPQLYERLVSSVAPTVFGHHDIKRAILLMLFGGVHKCTHEGIHLRGDINVCIVGDPSCAKSQFLKYVAGFLPRAVYTSGKSSSAAGLTASVVKEPETGEFCIEAGALMLADNGICCIDEFDKMDIKDQVAIHEAMEQQTISITKAGIQATLNARTSILAAANPSGGRYDKSKPLKYNVALPPAILSRFDLVHVMIDDPDDTLDYNVARHIVSVHQKKDEALSPEFTTAELQRYVAHGRSLKPELSDEARDLLVESYVQLRRGDAVPGTQVAYRITVRQLEALIRLSEAIARLHHADIVLPAHVREAKRLLSTSIISVDSHEINLDHREEDIVGRPRQVQENGASSSAVEAMDDIEAEGQALDAGDGGPDDQRQKIKVTYEHFQMVTRILVMKLREHEEACEEDGLAAGMKQADLVTWYLEHQASRGLIADMAQAVEEWKRVNAIIQHLFRRDGVLMVLDEGNEAYEAAVEAAALENDAARPVVRAVDYRILFVNPNYEVQ